MPIKIQNTRDLLGAKLRWKVLVIAPSRIGKTTWMSTAPNLGVAACETGHGQGLSSVMTRELDYFVPSCMEDIDALASGHIFADKETIGVDSFSAVNRTIIRGYAVKMPRRGVESEKRRLGIPELDDYQSMGEIARRVLTALTNLDKNLVVTCLLKTQKNAEGSPVSCGPDLPGMMYDVAPSLFDTVLYLKARKAFRNPSDPKSAYTQRYFITQPDGFHVGGDRNNINGKPILAAEEIFDITTGQGTFPDLYAKISAAYSALKN